MYLLRFRLFLTKICALWLNAALPINSNAIYSHYVAAGKKGGMDDVCSAVIESLHYSDSRRWSAFLLPTDLRNFKSFLVSVGLGEDMPASWLP